MLRYGLLIIACAITSSANAGLFDWFGIFTEAGRKQAQAEAAMHLVNKDCRIVTDFLYGQAQGCAYPRWMLQELTEQPNTWVAITGTLAPRDYERIYWWQPGDTPVYKSYRFDLDHVSWLMEVDTAHEKQRAFMEKQKQKFIAKVAVHDLLAWGFGGIDHEIKWFHRMFESYHYGAINKRLEKAVGYAEVQGRRSAMEDFMIIKCGDKCATFGMFDGHGGQQVAHKVAMRFRHLGNGAVTTDGDLIKLFKDIDDECARLKGGSTGTIAIVDKEKNELVMINLGDSRQVLLDGAGKVLAATVDHKPTDAAEKQRVEAAGGFVRNGRVDGVLAVSCAFGDFDLKPIVDGVRQYHVGIEPAITRHTLPKEGYLVIACDGLWDVMNNDQVAKFMMAAHGAGMSPSECAKSLVRAAYEGPEGARMLPFSPEVTGASDDNISVQVISIARLRESGVLRRM